MVILGADQNLWKLAPLHAYGLIVFVVVDFAVAGLVIAKASRMVFTLAAAWGIIRILLQIGDISRGPSLGFSYSDFATYLFNPVGTYPPNPTGVPGALIDLIVILEIIVIVVALSVRSSAQK